MERLCRAKFVCASVQNHGASGSEQINMLPVATGSKENESFSKYTPAGSFMLTITNPNLFGAFVQGQEYYIDITPAVTEEEKAATEG